jgi:spermidine synthase
MMFHGTTSHGLERIDTAAQPEPMLYYGKAGPLGDVMATLGPRSDRIGAIGLGIGSVACYARADQSWTFYEIDPLVYALAKESGLFRSLPVCAPQAQVVLGDGRLNLAKAEAGSYDLLILDAFASDAIPIHLLTREAFDGYRRVLAPHGALVVHLTNRHFDLGPIIARLADATSLVVYERSFVPPPGSDIARAAPSRWMVLARSRADLAGLASDPNWTARQMRPATPLWTDDFANILSALR